MAENRKGVFGLLKSLLSRSEDLYGSVYVKRFGPVRMITIGTAAGKDAGTLPAKDLPIDIVGVYGKVYNGSTYVDCIVSIDKTTGKVTITDMWGGAISGMQIGYMRPRSITYLANWGGYGLTSILSRLAERWWEYEDSTETAGCYRFVHKGTGGKRDNKRRCRDISARKTQICETEKPFSMVRDTEHVGQTSEHGHCAWKDIQWFLVCGLHGIHIFQWRSEGAGYVRRKHYWSAVQLPKTAGHHVFRGIGRISEGRCAA